MTIPEFGPNNDDYRPENFGVDPTPEGFDGEFEPGEDVSNKEKHEIQKAVSMLMIRLFDAATPNIAGDDTRGTELAREVGDSMNQLAGELIDRITEHYPLIASAQFDLGEQERQHRDLTALANADDIGSLFRDERTPEPEESGAEREEEAESIEGSEIDYTELANIPQHEEDRAEDLTAEMIERFYGEPENLDTIDESNPDERKAAAKHNDLLQEAHADVASTLLGWYGEIQATTTAIEAARAKRLEDDFKDVLKAGGVEDPFIPKDNES